MQSRTRLFIHDDPESVDRFIRDTPGTIHSVNMAAAGAPAWYRLWVNVLYEEVSDRGVDVEGYREHDRVQATRPQTVIEETR